MGQRAGQSTARPAFPPFIETVRRSRRSIGSTPSPLQVEAADVGGVGAPAGGADGIKGAPAFRDVRPETSFRMRAMSVFLQ